jgi:hypothetical protein
MFVAPTNLGATWVQKDEKLIKILGVKSFGISERIK